MNEPQDLLRVSCSRCGATNRVPAARLRDAPKCGSCSTALLDGTPLDLTTSGFERFLARNDLPVLIDFWAPWCAPCRMMAPAFAETARAFATTLRCAKLDTEAHPAPAQRFNVRSIPTLILFQGGREIARISGARDSAALRSWLTTTLSGSH
jgi:thioredoxin 2